MPDNEQFVVRYTNKDIMDKLDKLERKFDMVKADAQKTSSRAVIISSTALTLSLIAIGVILRG